MRILAFSPFDLDTLSGNVVTLRRIERGLLDRGHGCTIIAVSAETTEQEALSAAEGAAPDVIHFYHAYKTGRLLPALGRWPSVVTVSGTDLNHDASDPERRPAVERALAGADRIVTYNPSLLNLPAVQAVATKASLIPKGVWVGTSDFDLRAAAGFAKDDFLVLQSGGIRPVKDNLFALDALEPLRAEIKHLRLTFVGPILDEAYGSAFSSRLSEFPGARHLPSIEPEKIAAAYRSADVVLNTSRMEGLSNALMEAMTVGAVVLASDIPGNRDLLQGRLGWMLYRDAGDLREKLRKLAGAPDLRSDLEEAAREHAGKTFSTEREIDGLLEAYAAAINRRTPS